MRGFVTLVTVSSLLLQMTTADRDRDRATSSASSSTPTRLTTNRTMTTRTPMTTRTTTPPPIIDQFEDNCLSSSDASTTLGLIFDVSKDPGNDAEDSKLSNATSKWWDALGGFAQEMSRYLQPQQFYVGIVAGGTTYYLNSEPPTTTTSTTTPSSAATNGTTPKPRPTTAPPRLSLKNLTMTALGLYGQGLPPTSDSTTKTFKFVIIVTDGSQKNDQSTFPADTPRFIIDIGGRWISEVALTSYKKPDVYIVDNAFSLFSVRRTARLQFCNVIPMK